MSSVYLNGLGVFLPNRPVGNDGVENVLGHLGRRSSQVKRRVLGYNGIKERHYAVDPSTGEQSHTNAAMTGAAVRAAAEHASDAVEDIELLACGTSSPDQLVPAHGSMVHAELAMPPCEVATTAGVCCSGVTALKYAVASIAAGMNRNAVATGSELASARLRAANFRGDLERQITEKDLHKNPKLAFSKEFLRWMLSDGAGAVWLGSSPREDGLSLRVDWIDVLSYANEAETCMYAGAKKLKDGRLQGFAAVPDPEELIRDGYLSLAQDVGVLQARLPELLRRAFLTIAERREFAPEDVDWFLPHYSSEAFRQPLYDGLAAEDFTIPWDKWFTNLTTKGNTGAASIYIILEELVSSGRAKDGDRLVCVVPESARMTFALMHLTAVRQSCPAAQSDGSEADRDRAVSARAAREASVAAG